MPRPKSDKFRMTFMVEPSTLDDLDTVANHRGWFADASPSSGQPNRSKAVRELAAREAGKIRRRKDKAASTT